MAGAGSLVLSGAVVAAAPPTAAQPNAAAPRAGVSAPAAATAATVSRQTAVPVTGAAARATKKSTKRAMLNRKAVLRVAAKQKGKPYRYGATGPRAFDCSGFTQYVMKTQKRKLARTAAQQYRQAKRVAKSKAKPGDLIFSRSSSGRVYHVGIYAGKGRIWHSPRSGKRVHLAKIYAKNWSVGRIH